MLNEWELFYFESAHGNAPSNCDIPHAEQQQTSDVTDGGLGPGPVLKEVHACNGSVFPFQDSSLSFKDDEGVSGEVRERAL